MLDPNCSRLLAGEVACFPKAIAAQAMQPADWFEPMTNAHQRSADELEQFSHDDQ